MKMAPEAPLIQKQATIFVFVIKESIYRDKAPTAPIEATILKTLFIGG